MGKPNGHRLIDIPNRLTVILGFSPIAEMGLGTVGLYALVFGGVAAQDFLERNSSFPSDGQTNDSVKASWWGVNRQPCDVPEILENGDTKSYYLYNKFHNEYMSTDGSNVDLWHDKGSHAIWHLKHVEGHTANRFYLVNDRRKTYLSAKDWAHGNVELWGNAFGLNTDYSSHKELQWLIFNAAEITTGAPRCTFYIMHSDSHQWLDTHGDNVHVWGDRRDIFEMGGEPENLQWELKPVPAWR